MSNRITMPTNETDKIEKALAAAARQEMLQHYRTTMQRVANGEMKKCKKRLELLNTFLLPFTIAMFIFSLICVERLYEHHFVLAVIIAVVALATIIGGWLTNYFLKRKLEKKLFEPVQREPGQKWTPPAGAAKRAKEVRTRLDGGPIGSRGDDRHTRTHNKTMREIKKADVIGKAKPA